MNIQRLSPTYAKECRALMLEAYELYPGAFASSAAERAAQALYERAGFIQFGLEPFAVGVGVPLTSIQRPRPTPVDAVS